MALSRDDTLKLLEVFSGLFYIGVVGYKVNSGDEGGDALRWLETFAVSVLTVAKIVDNYFKMKDRRARMCLANVELEERRDEHLRGGILLTRLAARVKLNQDLQQVLLDYHLGSNLINLVLATSTSANILGIWAKNPLLSYCSAGMGVLSQSMFSYFQTHKSTQSTNQAFSEYDAEMWRLEVL